MEQISKKTPESIINAVKRYKEKNPDKVKQWCHTSYIRKKERNNKEIECKKKPFTIDELILAEKTQKSI